MDKSSHSDFDLQKGIVFILPLQHIGNKDSGRSGIRYRGIVVNPEWFISNPDPATTFKSSGSGSRQKFRIQQDPNYFKHVRKF